MYCPEEKELSRAEYIQLSDWRPKEKSSERLALLLESICATGIRVSELQYITAEAVAHVAADRQCKGKTRTVFLPTALQKKLKRYMQKLSIRTGSVFVTRTGKPLNRSNIWREMKALCERANVAPSKVFPHSLRHLLARCFYSIDHDVSETGGYFRPLEHQYHSDLYHDHGGGASPENGKHASHYLKRTKKYQRLKTLVPD